MAANQKIDVLAELDRLGQRYEFAGDDNVKVLCPFHADKDPSCSVSTKTGDFKCFACGKGGDIVSLISGYVDRPRQIVLIDLQQRYDVGEEASVDPEVVEKYHVRIWLAPPLLDALHVRGITDEAIRQQRLGETEGRITIPIKNMSGRYVNVKSYLPGAPSKNKMRNLKGRGKPRFYPIEQLRYDKIAVCGGEIKGLAAAIALNPHGIGGIGTTCGESNWDETFNVALAGKHVWIIDDIDETGITSAEMKARVLYQYASWVGIVRLPLNPEKYTHGDVNDFIGREHGDLFSLLESVPKWEPPSRKVLDDSEVPLEVPLGQVYSADNTGRRVKVIAVVSAIADDTYPIPAVLDVMCDRAQECCALCRVYAERKTEYKIHPEDPANISMIDATDAMLRQATMKALGVPPRCPSYEFTVKDYRQADDIRVSPKLDMLGRDVERTMQRMVCVKGGLQLNENYAFTGRQYPSPRDQGATLLASSYESTGDDLTSFVLEDPTRLMKFRPREWTTDALTERLDEIYADLEYNVTFIRQRKNMHAMMDLVWHSPLFMMLDGRVEKAYAETLIVGDSGQGKSETVKRLLEHYGAGLKTECKNASNAGLLGGLMQLNGRWFVSWGLIPTHDRRMVILEELKGMPVEIIARLTDMRSSGIAEIPKIEKRRAMARTRLLALSNPRSEQPMSAYAFGVEAIRELIGALEDVRRFDACMILSKDEVSEDVINQPRSQWPYVAHTYDAAACHDLILWSWTRPESNVVFEQEAEHLVLKLSSQMCKRFTGDIPIVDVASMRLKLARLSAAVAARTFSTPNDDTDTLLIRTCHVQWLHDFISDHYASTVFGYLDYSKAVETSKQIVDVESIKKAVYNVMHARDFATCMLNMTRFSHQDLQDWSGTDRIDSSALVSLLVRKHAIVREGIGYMKTPGMIGLLKTMMANGLANQELPSHLTPDNPKGDF